MSKNEIFCILRVKAKFFNMPNQVQKLLSDLKVASNSQKAKLLGGFFKSGKGQYGEGDIFLGIYVPIQRAIAKKYEGLEFNDLESLLKSKIHEHRLVALFILVSKFKKGDNKIKEKIFKFYLKNIKGVNNWDLVDQSAPNIIGQWIQDKPKDILYKLARSNNLWEKRIAILSTLAFIREKKFEDTIKISEILMNDKHDLIHKSVGWMLREVGKKEEAVLIKFLNKHTTKMPRTMLRYSIEKFNQETRKYYLCLK